jgi:DNA-binding transcriptional regulator YiaG
MLTGGQIKAARAIVHMTQAQLATIARVSIDTVRRLENFHGPVAGYTRTVMAMRRALEEAGALFIDEEEGSGVHLRTD